jgi:hypothetical protein
VAQKRAAREVSRIADDADGPRSQVDMQVYPEQFTA